ncbi:hypothetical protein FK531_14555 [Rhodococcus spelaei]|uniref:DUF2231 domain-containing protein n=1 Tax=Rhodococcus spelaei TaxID=2546320 RepID=A0A541B7L2_9NOCA|nr:DUF2231 domain-containing protein [Rhodococcus spelaei]TQF68316.1 hypothetical protein FK531_14555 [Rhodococcus spelaei]
MSIRDVLGRAESVTALDPVSDALRTRVLRGLDDRPAAGLLRGSWLGHPVHPAMVAVPLGAWTSSLVLDIVFRDHLAARRMIGFGLIAVPPALATGWADWSLRDAPQRRAGLIHAAGNTVAVVLMLASYRRRKAAPGFRASALSVLGLGAAGAAGALGGHIAFSADASATVPQAAVRDDVDVG